jgi:hypothetical protein
MMQGGHFSPGDNLSFGEAFALSRKAGNKIFNWKGKLYHTRTREEEEARAAKTSPASQEAMKKTPVGEAVSGAAPSEEKSLLASMPQFFEENLGTIKALLTLDEASPQMPEALRQVSAAFKNAAAESGKLPGGRKTREADTFRHVEGARDAALQAGVLPTLIGSTAHEIKNLIDLALSEGPESAAMSAMGEPISFMQGLKESATDIGSNLRGIGQAVVSPLVPGGAQLFKGDPGA